MLTPPSIAAFDVLHKRMVTRLLAREKVRLYGLNRLPASASLTAAEKHFLTVDTEQRAAEDEREYAVILKALGMTEQWETLVKDTRDGIDQILLRENAVDEAEGKRAH